MPRPGDLRERVRIERRTQTPTGFPGEWADGYAPAIERAADVRAMTGREAERAGQTTAEQPYTVTLRAEPTTIAALRPSSRVVWLRPGHPLGDVVLSVTGEPVEERQGASPGYLVAVCNASGADAPDPDA